MGHSAYGNIEDNRKGIYDKVLFNNSELLNWTHKRILLNDEQFIANLNNSNSSGAESFYKGTFEVADLNDTYFDMRNFTKGYLFVNDINLGRYWNIGYQFRLYCPGVFLNIGEN